MLLSARPTDCGILAATLALAVAATLALTSGYIEITGRQPSDAPAAINRAQAATARASSAPAPVHRKHDAPAPVGSLTLDDQRGVALYLVIKAGRPQPLFAR